MKATILIFLSLFGSVCGMEKEELPLSSITPDKNESQFLTFEEINELFETYNQNPKDPAQHSLRGIIITGINSLMQRNAMKSSDKETALAIAIAMNAATLTSRLQVMGEENFGALSILPSDILKYVIRLMSEGKKPKDIRNLLLVSKSFNELLLDAALIIKLEDESINNEVLENINQIFPRAKLEIQLNNGTDDDLKSLKDLKNIFELTVTNCQKITDAGLAHLSPLTSLSILSLLDGWKITDVGLAHLSNLINLTKLTLENLFKTTDNGLKFIENLKNLSVLAIINCPEITNTTLTYLRKLKNIAQITLNNINKITDDGLKLLESHKNLTYLDLYFCENITDVGLSYLYGFKKLTKLFLTSARVTEEGIQSLKQKIPTLMIEHLHYIDSDSESDIDTDTPDFSDSAVSYDSDSDTDSN